MSRVKSYKLVLLGDSAVGKSCINSRFIHDEFYEFQEPTIGAAFSTKKIEVDNKTVKYEIWDTAGQERYRALAPMYYRGASVAVIVYDITCNYSFEGAKIWLKEIQKNGNKNCLIVLVGNKCDLESEREVKEEEVNYLLNPFILHVLVSAKTGENIKYLFDEITKRLPDKIIKEEKVDLLDVNSIKEDNNSYNCCF
jgi:small GTP-binding protein